METHSLSFPNPDAPSPTLASVVLFMAPWCPHSQALWPLLRIVAGSFNTQDSVTFATVDIEAHPLLAAEHDVHATPTIMWFPSSTLSTREFQDTEGQGTSIPSEEVYSGLADVSNIFEWVRSRVKSDRNIVLRRPGRHVVTMDEETFHVLVADPRKTVFINFNAKYCKQACEKTNRVWEELALAFAHESHVVIAEVDAGTWTSLAEQNDISGYPTLKILRPHDGYSSARRSEVYYGSIDLYDLVETVNRNAGTFRRTDGELQSHVGIHKNLQPHVERFWRARRLLSDGPKAETVHRESVGAEATSSEKRKERHGNVGRTKKAESLSSQSSVISDIEAIVQNFDRSSLKEHWESSLSMYVCPRLAVDLVF